MSGRILELTFENGESSLSPRRFAVYEALSRPYEVNVFARSDRTDLELESFIHREASFTIVHDDGAVGRRTWAGICTHFELARAASGRGEADSTYHIRIEPRLWQLRRRSDCRIFQRMRWVDVVLAVLQEHEIEPRVELVEEHRPRDFVVQYDETDDDFVHRLLERAGISYFFDFAGDKAGELVLTDAPHRGEPRVVLPHADSPTFQREQACVKEVSAWQAVRPARAVCRDYDFRKPQRPVVGHADRSAPEVSGELYGWAPGASWAIGDGGGDTPHADDKAVVRALDGEAERRAQLDLEAQHCRSRLIRFETTTVETWPGTVARVENHPHPAVAAPFLVDELCLEGSLGESAEWTKLGQGARTDVPYRPRAVTPTPVIRGVQSALVVGPPGEEIHTDELGRVRLQFPWDRDGRYDDDSSCWIRVSQSWAGAGYGAVVLPRVGQEVLVAFVEGDPDQPVIVGRVYDGINPIPPENQTPGYGTRSTWKSQSSPAKAGSFHEIRFEDEADRQFVYWQAQRDWQRLVKHHETERTAENRGAVVGRDRSAVVGRQDVTRAGEKHSLQVIAPPSAEDLKIATQDKPEVKPLPTKTELADGEVLYTTGDATMVMQDHVVFGATKLIGLKAGERIAVEGSKVHINPAGRADESGCLEKAAGSGAPFVDKT